MRPAPIPLGEAAKTIAKSSTHLLICDTCSLLDIVRLPVRVGNSTSLAHTLSEISRVWTKVDSQQVTVVCPEPIPMEWDRNICETAGETENHLKNMIHTYEVMSVLAQMQGTALMACPIDASAITAFLRDLSERFLDASIIVKRDESVILRATERAIQSTPPARKGTVKDSVIYEHMLQLFTLLPSAVPGAKRIFLTSNVRDFCIGTTPKPPIDAELAKHSAQLCTTWSSSAAQL